MKALLFALGFLAIYLVGGRKIAVPFGMLFFNNILSVILIVFALDMLQLIFYHFIFSYAFERIGMLNRLRRKQKKRIRSYKMWRLAGRFGILGVFILASLPSFGGGVWSSVLLGISLKIDKKILFLLVGFGNLFGIAILALFSSGIIAILR